MLPARLGVNRYKQLVTERDEGLPGVVMVAVVMVVLVVQNGDAVGGGGGGGGAEYPPSVPLPLRPQNGRQTHQETTEIQFGLFFFLMWHL